MALGRAYSVAVSGVDGQLVEIEADIGRGLPGIHLVGLRTRRCRNRATGCVRAPLPSRMKEKLGAIDNMSNPTRVKPMPIGSE